MNERQTEDSLRTEEQANMETSNLEDLRPHTPFYFPFLRDSPDDPPPLSLVSLCEVSLSIAVKSDRRLLQRVFAHLEKENLIRIFGLTRMWFDEYPKRMDKTKQGFTIRLKHIVSSETRSLSRGWYARRLRNTRNEERELWSISPIDTHRFQTICKLYPANIELRLEEY